MSIAGGFPTKDKLDFLNHKNGNVILQYEAKFDIEVSDIPKSLYHLTTCEKINSVLKMGLTPRSSTEYFNFKDRIYLATSKNSLTDLAIQKSAISKNSLSDLELQKSVISRKKCFIVLEINLNGVTDRIRFFRDPNFIEGIYTLENIPKNAIEPIEKILIDENGKASINPI